MKAVLIYQYGGPEQLRYEETATPKCGDDEVLVKLRATSVNPIDMKRRSGAAKSRMPVEFPGILGRDLAGEVAEAGGSVKSFTKGMRVMALADHTYAEYVVAKADLLCEIPGGLEFEKAGALPLVTLTGAQLIERAVKPESGQTVLVTGALGSVGRSAVHVAKQHGARVLAGVRANEKEEAAKLKVDGVIAINSDEEINRLHDLDAIADTIGGTTIQKLFKAIRKGGVLGSVLGEPEGAKQQNIRVEALMSRPEPGRLRQLAEDVAKHEFSIPIARTMKLSETQEAHRLLEAHKVNGKIVLVP